MTGDLELSWEEFDDETLRNWEPPEDGGKTKAKGTGLSSFSEDEQSVMAMFAAGIRTEQHGSTSSAGELFKGAIKAAQERGVSSARMSKVLDQAKVQVDVGHAKSLRSLDKLAGKDGKINVFDMKKFSQMDRKALLNQGHIEQTDVRHYKITDTGRSLMSKHK
jgi:hypothetical protein